MTHFTPVFSAIGGALIGLSASILLAGSGRIAGISGIFGGALVPKANDAEWRIWFLAGLISAGVVWRALSPASFGAPIAQPLLLTIFAGLLVGVGTQIGNGCTSGHGVCGISRGSKRSITATLIFMATAAITVFVVRHVAGGS
jgi:uncharacterized membrane protein YedE/YeeE